MNNHLCSISSRIGKDIIGVKLFDNKVIITSKKKSVELTREHAEIMCKVITTNYGYYDEKQEATKCKKQIELLKKHITLFKNSSNFGQNGDVDRIVNHYEEYVKDKIVENL